MNKEAYCSILMDKAETFAKTGNRITACSLLDEILVIDPRNTLVIQRLAMLHAQNSDHLKALELYQKLVELHPENLEARLLLGIEYAETHHFQSAVECFLFCIANSPPNALFHKLCGITLSDGGNHREALNQLTIANRIAPEDEETLVRLGIELIHFLNMGEAEIHLLHALDLNPNSALAYNNLGRVYKFQGKIEEAIETFRKALALQPHNYVVADNLLLSLNYLFDISPERVAEEHRQLSLQVYNSKVINTPVVSHANLHQPLRVGYVSGDFHNHSVSFFIEPVLMHHNPENIQVFCYSNGTVEDETTRRLMGYNVQWRNIAPLSDQNAAALIHEDKIDILVDLSGHSSGNRLGLFSLKPATFQASWIGYPHSTGLKQMDYYFSDAICDPPGMTEHLYTEEIIRLPRVFSCYLPPLQFPAIVPPPGVESGIITFGSFNNFAKVNTKTLEMWADILKQVPNSRLLLKSMALGDKITQQKLYEMFASHGVENNRIALINSVNSSLEHLALYGQVDIALDTFPYNGTTTTCEALWMGVPVITLSGTTHAARVGGSLLSTIGCGELVAGSRKDYVKRAAALAENIYQIVYYRNNLRKMMSISPLMDAKRLTRDIEEAFINICSNKDTYGKYQSLP